MSRFGTVAAAALLGMIGSAFYLSMFTLSPAAAILGSLAQLPLFVAGLWLGTGAAALAGLTAVAIVLAAARDIIGAALFAGLYAGPVVVLVRQALLARSGSAGALEWYPPGRLTAWLTGFALAMFGIALFWFGGPRALHANLRQALAPTLAQLIDTTAAERDALTEAFAAVVPGILAASWMMLVITNAVLAQGVLARFGANWRPSPRLAALVLPIWITALLGAAAGAALFDGPARFLGINAMIVLFVPFCLAGLAVMHAVINRLARPAIPLVLFYLLAGLFGWPLVLVAFLGLFDVPLDLRRRFARPANIGGEIDG
jgi:hypothetical protein